MQLKEYFNKVKEQIEKGNYQIKQIKNQQPKSINHPYIEAINYIMYEWADDHKQNIKDILWDYILIPNDCDIDFTKVSFEEFFQFLVEIKS